MRDGSLTAVALALGLVGFATPAPAEYPCPLEAGGHGVVAAVPDGGTVVLEDGTAIRLLNTLAPQAPPAGRDAEAALAAEARTWLEQAMLGRAVRYAHIGRRVDRHGQLRAHLFLEGADAGWVQAALVDRGLARVYSFAGDRACAGALLQKEAAARTARRGIWATEAGAILPAEPPRQALAEVGRFAIVEGIVESVGERRLRTYLNFGTYWNVDFTVMVSGRDRDRFAQEGIDLGALGGRTVRVRGWILDDRGPAMAVTHPEQIEIVGER